MLNVGNILPINILINNIKRKLNRKILFIDLKKELLRKDIYTNSIYHLNMKENSDLCMIYYQNLPHNDTRNNLARKIEHTCKSYILDKKTLQGIATQFNKVIYNKDALKIINNVPFNQLSIQKSYEGIDVLIYNHNNKWYVSTRRCLRADESKKISNKSFIELLNSTRRFEFKELDKNLCYHFILVHYRNRNIINYRNLGKDYKKLIHTMTTKKYTFEEIDTKINDEVIRSKNINFESLTDVLDELNRININNLKNKKITEEGFTLKYYHGEKYKSHFTILKLQTNIYQKILNIKPNNFNMDQNYLELYQKDLLSEFLPYFTKFPIEIKRRIHLAMKNLSREFLDLYHTTRNKNNPNLYHKLTEKYKKVLYGLHGLYIEHRGQDFIDKNNTVSRSFDSSKSINIHDVYHFLKDLSPHELRQIFLDRSNLMRNRYNKFINRHCIYTKTQTVMMFRDKFKKN